jgi:hypothetical protein
MVSIAHNEDIGGGGEEEEKEERKIKCPGTPRSLTLTIPCFPNLCSVLAFLRFVL